MRLKQKIRHRILAASLSLALVLSLPFFTPEYSYGAAKFWDIGGHWAEGFITRAYLQNVVGGYPNGLFQPDKSVTRAEFVSMINNAFDINVETDAVNFKDVPYGQWYTAAVATAVTAAYASGSGDSFRPDSPISRQEAAVMLSNILPNYKGGGNLKSYRDYRLIASWATAALEKMTGRQYFGAYTDGRLHPTDSLTRAQAAKILCDILDNETIVTKRTTVDEDKAILSEKIYTGDVTIDEDLAEGSATIDNCVILGKLTVNGGGSKSITINNSRIANMEVDKEDSAVRIVTKGSTVIPKLSASGKSILQTAGKDGYGILNVSVNKNADVTLKGNFPIVNIVGSTATIALESGKINSLTVTGAGKNSDITLSGKAQLLEATVNAEAYYHGEGVITQMFVNADGITYETKPIKMTVDTTVDRAIEEGGEDVDVTFSPKNKASDVDVDSKITLTFTSSMKMADGKAITASNIKDFISLKTNSKDGDAVEFTAEINSAKKIITLTPTSDLNTNTKYYVILNEEALINAGGNKSDGASAYFITSTKGGSTSGTFTPSNGATRVSASTAIKIKFAGDVVKYGDGSVVTAAYLQECVQLKAGGSGGSNVAFTGTISSSDTITITPSGDLAAGQTYYVAIVANKLKTKDGGKTISASSATWTVAAATAPAVATLSTLTLAPSGGSNVLTGFNGATTTYNLTVPFGTNSVDVAASAASGTTVSINSTQATSATNITVNKSAITTITVSAAANGMTTTSYQLNIEVAGNTALDGVWVNGMKLSTGQDIFSENVLPLDTAAVISIVTIDPAATIRMGSNTGTNGLSAIVDLVSGNQSTFTFTVTSNRTTKTYTIVISRYSL